MGWAGFLVLALLAMFLWGPDRLPKLLKDIRRFVAKAREMASRAARDLSNEVGTDIKVEDLHPKTFIRKHVLSEEDEAMLRDPVKGVLSDLDKEADSVKDSFKNASEDTSKALDSTDTPKDSTDGGSGRSGRRNSSFDDAT